MNPEIEGDAPRLRPMIALPAPRRMASTKMHIVAWHSRTQRLGRYVPFDAGTHAASKMFMVLVAYYLVTYPSPSKISTGPPQESKSS